ncbi:MAG: hypothetical protein JSS76_08275 [Bacteroidetes bacterium]|nr:hypothetical protein [Bacteroidota bacterium]
MLITINVDPTELTEGVGIGLMCDKDYADYVKGVEIIFALEKLAERMKQEVAKVVTKNLTAPPVPGEKFNEKCMAVTITDMMKNGMDLTPPKKN